MLGTSLSLFRHIKCQNLSIISDSIGIPPKRGKKNGKKIRRSHSRRNLIHIEEDIGQLVKFYDYIILIVLLVVTKYYLETLS